MLQVHNLTKRYESKDGVTFALDSVNLEFNKNEFVFVVGKSGSGKSTLLNILGSLDKPTSGEVFLNNESLHDFDNNQTNIYRQNIAFIFQDFALIDNLNVRDNIKLARSDVIDEDIKLALEKVELPGFEDRKIQTLSAGQKQRVAIARGIVKNPKIILCDEPTGNLDFATSQAIIKCLKTLANDTLVLFVSHNLDDAYTYANRIIELDNGKVIRDIQVASELGNKAYVIENNSLYLTTIKSLDDQEIDEINREIKTGQIKKIHPKKELFKDHQIEEDKDIEIGKTYKKIKTKDLFSFSNKVLEKQFVKTSLFALIGALVLSVFSIAFSFVTFNSQSYTSRSLNASKENNIRYVQFTKDTSNVDENGRCLPLSPYFDEQVIGEKYVDYCPIVDIEVPGTANSITAGPYRNTNPIDKTCIFKDRKVCFNTSSGAVIITEESFSKNLNGGRPFKIIEQAEEYKDYGVYITDVAMKWLKRDHIDYLGEKKSALTPSKDYFYGAYINGVVETDLEDRFPEFKQYLYSNNLNSDDYKTFTRSKDFDKFLRVVGRYSTFYYSFNKNFLEDFRNVRRDFKWFTNYGVVLEASKKYASEEENEEENSVLVHSRGYFGSQPVNSIPQGYCNVSLGLLNTMMKEEEEHTKEEWNEILDTYGRGLTLHNAIYDVDGYTHPVFNFQIRAITDSDGVFLSLNNDDANEVNKTSFYEVGLVSFDSEFFSKNEELFENLHIKITNSYATIGTSVAKTINAYNGLFKVVFYIMLIAALFIVFVAAFDAIRRQTYSVGVMKSLGLKESSIFSCFLVHQIEFILMASILSLIGEIVFMSLANQLLVVAFKSLFNLSVRPVVPVIEFTPVVYLVTLAIIIGITTISLIASFIFIKKMKIVDILKSKY